MAALGPPVAPHEATLTQMHARLGRIEGRLTGIEARLTGLERRILDSGGVLALLMRVYRWV